MHTNENVRETAQQEDKRSKTEKTRNDAKQTKETSKTNQQKELITASYLRSVHTIELRIRSRG